MSFRLVSPGPFATKSTTVRPSILNDVLKVNAYEGGTVVFPQPIDNTLSTVDFTLKIGANTAQVGDRLLIFIRAINPGGNTVTMNLDPIFFLTFCGESSSSVTITDLERWELLFFWDGEKFVCTTDNC